MEYLEQITKELKKLKPHESILENIKKECRALNIVKKEKALVKKPFAFIKNKRIFNFISVIAVSLAVVIALAVLLPVLLRSPDNPQGYSAGLEYKLIDNKFYEVSIGAASDEDIIIPLEYNNLPVQRIAKNGFMKTDIKSVTIPDSVVSIERSAIYTDGELTEGAFYGCGNLVSVVLPNSLVSIGAGAFAECKALESITIPKSVTDIQDCAFYGSGLKSIIIPSSIKSIENNVFSYCDNLTDVSIPNSVEKIGDGAFAYCRSLTDVSIPDNVKSIGAGAFSNCTSLSSITIPANVVIIGAHAFSNCENLSISAEAISKPSGWSDDLGNSSIEWGYIPDLIYNLINGSEYEVLKGSKDTDVIIIPGEHNGMPVTSVADNAFSYSNIISCIIPDSIKNIKEKAFYKCNNLKSITIPKNVAAVGENAFDRGLTIFAETFNKPAGWTGNWKKSQRPVVWGCELSDDKTYVVSFVVTSNINGAVRYNAPYRLGYTFVHWEGKSSNKNGYYKAHEINKAKNGSTLTAIWE